MKKVFLFCLVLLSSCAAPKKGSDYARKDDRIISRETSSITFVVDRGVQPVKEEYSPRQENEERIFSSSLRYCGAIKDSFESLWEWEEAEAETSKTEHRLVKSSFSGHGITHNSSNVMFDMFIRAYSKHRPLVLSPDAVWLLISQSFSYYVNTRSEEFRSSFVDHEGKSLLSVVSSTDLFDENTNWNLLLDTFSELISSHTKGDIAQTLVANFSTTGSTERIVSQATLMNAMQSYFEYEVMWIACGIPAVTLTGTPEDWKNVLEKARNLGSYGVQWWIDELCPVLEEFVKASEGHPDYGFWQDMVCTRKPGEIRGASCARHPKRPTEFDGWFLKFFPFDKDGRTPDKVTMLHHMLPEIVRIEFKYKTLDGFGNVISEFPMELLAGFVGYDEDPETFVLTPVMGWMVGTY